MKLLCVASKHKQMKKEFQNCGKFTVTEAQVMDVIGKKLVLMKEITEKLKTTKSATTQIINKLINRQLVERSYDKKDRRVNLVSLTNKGLAIHKEYNNCKQKLTKSFTKSLTKTEFKNTLIF
jgi:DNA-binding MarR family transcriptional regulator